MNRLETERNHDLYGAAYFQEEGIVRIALGAPIETNMADTYAYLLSQLQDKDKTLRILFVYLLGHEMGHFYQHLGGFYPEVFGAPPPHYYDHVEVNYLAGSHEFAKYLPESFFNNVVRIAIIEFGWYLADYYPKVEIVPNAYTIANHARLTPSDPKYNNQDHEVGAQITGNQLSVAYAQAHGLPQVTIGYHRLAKTNSEWVEDKDLPIEHRRKTHPGQVGK